MPKHSGKGSRQRREAAFERKATQHHDFIGGADKERALAEARKHERVEAGRHYPSDVLAGAAIGALSAGILDSLHWGSGPGRGIARPGADLRVGFVDRCHGVELSLEFGF